MSIITRTVHFVQTSNGQLHTIERKCVRKYRSVSADFSLIMRKHLDALEDMYEQLDVLLEEEMWQERNMQYYRFESEDNFLQIPVQEKSDYEEIAEVYKLRRSPRMEDILEYEGKI